MHKSIWGDGDDVCCGKQCCINPQYSPVAILRLRTVVSQADRNARHSFIDKCIRLPESDHPDTRGAKYQLPTLSPHFMLSDTDRGGEYNSVCLCYLVWATGVSRTQIIDRRRSPPKIDRGGYGVLATVRMSIQVWMIAMAAMYLCAPDSSHTYLPFSNKEQVYQMYALDVDPELGVLASSSPYFMMVWRSTDILKLITIHKWSKFTHCDDCEGFRNSKIEAGRDQTTLRKIRRDEFMHHRLVRNERGYYARRIQDAKSMPLLFLSINIDAADQAAYGYPYFRRQSKQQSATTKFKSHLMAAIVHGRGTYAWTFCDNIEHGNNLTIECLHQIFEDQAMKNGGKLPPKLYLQMDNTAKQCKGIYIYIIIYIYIYIYIYMYIYHNNDHSIDANDFINRYG
jgi:hypothetical protein